MKRFFAAALFIAVAVTGCTRPPQVRVTPEIYRPVKLNLTAMPDARFGSSTAVSADSTAIAVGAPGLYGQTNFPGMLVVYRRQVQEWTKTDLVPQAGGITPVYFGASVSLSADGNTVIGGAPFSLNADKIDCGAAYIFNYNGTNWKQSRFTAPAAGPGDWFGMSVALSGDGLTAAVGAPSDNYHGWAAGSVYVYRRTEGVWRLFASIRPPDPDTLDFFGISVSLSRDGNTLAVGSYRDDEKGEDNGAAYVFHYTGSNWTSRKIMSSVGERKQGFGFSVSLSADASILAVGARTADSQFADTGALYIYRLQNNSESETRIIASDRKKELYLGGSVSVSADGLSVFAGATGDSTHGSRSGAVYAYRWTGAGWSESKFYSPDAAADEVFGGSVSATRGGEYIAAGAPLDVSDSQPSGAVYYIPYSGGAVPVEVPSGQSTSTTIQSADWSQTTVSASDGQSGAFFGLQTALSLSGDRLVCAAGRDNGLGAVYVYDFDRQSYSWKETKLTARDGTNGQLFGYSAAVSSGDTIVVGAVGDRNRGDFTGTAYVYRWKFGGWRANKLVASDATNKMFFGNSAAVSRNGRTVVVGAFRDPRGGENSGAIYVYTRKLFGWNETKIVASDAQAMDQFGGSVSVSGDGLTIAVGAANDDDKAYNSGAVYIYRFAGGKWVETKLVSSGAAPDGSFGSSVSVSDDGKTVAVAALGEDAGGRDSGCVYVYRFDGEKWNESRVIPSDLKAGQGFGSSVSLSSDGMTLLAGSAMDKTRGDSAGAVYLFVYDIASAKWIQTKTTADDGVAGDVFGISVDISADGRIFAAGAYGRNERRGMAVVFRR